MISIVFIARCILIVARAKWIIVGIVVIITTTAFTSSEVKTVVLRSMWRSDLSGNKRVCEECEGFEAFHDSVLYFCFPGLCVFV